MFSHRVFFSLTTTLMIFWVPYNYAFILLFGHVILLTVVGGSGTILIVLSCLSLHIFGIIQTKKDPNWFEVLINYLRFYKDRPALIFKRRIVYVA